MTRAVFLDRDGTLMEDVHYCNDPGKVVAYPDVPGALQQLHDAGWLNIVVTNQSGIASGKISLEQYRAVEAELDRQLPGLIDASFFCPDPNHSVSPRRKPSPGMLEEAAGKFSIDLTDSWMIGDKGVDIDCGRAAGCKTILVLTGYGKNFLQASPTHVAKNLKEAVRFILASEGHGGSQ